MIPPEHPKDLFKRQGAEKGRTVEHGAFQPDRTPRKEVGSLEFVTTLVEIPFHCFSVQRTDGMLEESYSLWDMEGRERLLNFFILEGGGGNQTV